MHRNAEQVFFLGIYFKYLTKINMHIKIIHLGFNIGYRKIGVRYAIENIREFSQIHFTNGLWTHKPNFVKNRFRLRL